MGFSEIHPSGNWRNAMKKKLGARTALYPLPATLVGANVEGKPNFMTVAHVGVMDLGTVSLGMNKIHYTNQGIKENGTFSINIPTERLVKEVDYCGMVSGRKADKARLFEPFYGQLETAPMIAECPLNLECRLVQTVDMPNHDIFIGEVVEVYCDEECMDGDAIEFLEVKPILYAMGDPSQFTASSSYYSLGSRLAPAWEVGKELFK
jgi:flavin reductase (DIM6/NTAB) family NADH-FMN oxidoreductase RutF